MGSMNNENAQFLQAEITVVLHITLMYFLIVSKQHSASQITGNTSSYMGMAPA